MPVGPSYCGFTDGYPIYPRYVSFAWKDPQNIVEELKVEKEKP